MLEVKDLHKFYGPFHAVRGVSFSVARGEVIGFLGPNGAGKTTTMKIITGYMAMSSGEVRVDGLDVARDSLSVRASIGYLPENAPLYEDMTVIEYLRFMSDMRGLRGPKRRERLEWAIGVCGLEPKRRKAIKTLSKGYRQRTGLAQAILHDPKLVILDEPTVGLDPNQIIEIRELLREIGERNTVILSSHILSEVEATCGRVIIVNDGRIVAAGKPAELEARHADRSVAELILDAEPGAEIRDRIAALVGVAAVSLGESGGRERRFEIRREGATDLIADLAALAAREGWRIDRLGFRRVSLEDVFRELTSRRADATPQAVAVGAGTEGGLEA